MQCNAFDHSKVARVTRIWLQQRENSLRN